MFLLDFTALSKQQIIRRPLFARAGDAWDPLQVVRDCYVFPAGEESADAFCDGAADLDHQVTTGLQSLLGGGDQFLDDFEAGWASEDGSARLELADFELDFVFLGEAHVGRVGDDEIEGGRLEVVKQVGVVKENPADGRVLVGLAEFKLEPRGVGFGNFQRGGRVVGGVDFGLREFFCQGEGDRAGAGADIGNFRRFERLGKRKDGFDEVLGFGTRNEDGRRDDEVKSPELLMAGDVLCGHALGALGEGFVVAGVFLGTEFALGMGVKVSAIATEREHEEGLRVESRRGNVLGSETGDGGLEGFAQGHASCYFNTEIQAAALKRAVSFGGSASWPANSVDADAAPNCELAWPFIMLERWFVQQALLGRLADSS